MRWHTHSLCGISALWLVTPLLGGSDPNNIGVLAACAAFGALLPDLDATESKVKHLRFSGIKPLELPSVVLHQMLGHRGLLHSLVGLGLFATATIPLSFYIGWQLPLSLVLGYGSHLAADACTRSGIPFLYPNRQRHYLLPRAYRFVTGSLAEEILLPFLVTAVVLLLLGHLPFS